MLKTILALSLMFATLWGVDAASAEPMINLSSPDNLQNINPGQTVTIAVGVTGLQGESLEYLYVPVGYDDSMFSTPFNFVRGEIVPLTSSSLDFMTFDALGLAEGVFAPLDFNDTIGSNGTFFTFQVTALGPGRSSFRVLDGVSAVSSDAPFLSFTPAANQLDTVTTPEPSSLILACISIAAGIGFARRKFASELCQTSNVAKVP